MTESVDEQLVPMSPLVAVKVAELVPVMVAFPVMDDAVNETLVPCTGAETLRVPVPE